MDDKKTRNCSICIFLGLAALAGGLFLLYGPALPLIIDGGIVLAIGIIGLSR